MKNEQEAKEKVKKQLAEKTAAADYAKSTLREIVKTVEEQRKEEEAKPRVSLSISKPNADKSTEYLEKFAKTGAKEHVQQASAETQKGFEKLELFTHDDHKGKTPTVSATAAQTGSEVSAD